MTDKSRLTYSPRSPKNCNVVRMSAKETESYAF